MAVGIIAKLPATWRDFATTLKHKREDISTEDLVIALDVEEKARAKDSPSTSVVAENGVSANIVEKKFNKNKGKMQMQNSGKPKKTTNFKKKNEKDNKTCYVCGKKGHVAKNCRHRKNKDNEQKAVNMTRPDLQGIVIYSLFFQKFNPMIGGLIRVLMFICVLICLYFLLTKEHEHPPS